MGELQIQHPFSLPPPPLPPLPPPSPSRDDSAPPEPTSRDDNSPPPAPPFDPSRMIGIIKRKAMIKELAAAYHAECLTYCQELLELQKNIDEPFTDIKLPEEPRKEVQKPAKRVKKSR
ncbi:filamin-binding LIM protein 1-like [Salvia splendens]|uniref:filamin-binding LIM protein 1-like n=1 Tax=Salvia splendens TaxID=180675 RepID=UPI001C2760BF|nr:filamin-binding LIM protein 1-like [Salvia splendens]